MHLYAPVEVLALLSDLLGSALETGLHTGIGIVGDGDVVGRSTTTDRPTWTPWVPLTPLGLLGWWGRCSGPADSPMNLLGICQIVFESPWRMGGGSFHRSVQSKVYTP